MIHLSGDSSLDEFRDGILVDGDQDNGRGRLANATTADSDSVSPFFVVLHWKHWLLSFQIRSSSYAASSNLQRSSEHSVHSSLLSK